MNKKPKLIRFPDLDEHLLNDSSLRYSAKQGNLPLGIRTNIPSIDKELNGCFQPGIHILHGSPGSGKTALALQIGIDCGFPCIYLSCEMIPLELYRRSIARLTNTSLKHFKTGYLKPEEIMERADKAKEHLKNIHILDATKNYIPARSEDEHSLLEIVRDIKADSEHCLLIFDSLHSWIDASPSIETEYERINKAMADIRVLTDELNIPVLCITERKRSSNNKNTQDAGAGSRKIEYGAESVMGLDTQEESSSFELSDSEKKVTFKLTKNRNGSVGKEIDFIFHGDLQSFREV